MPQDKLESEHKQLDFVKVLWNKEKTIIKRLRQQET